MPPKIVKMNFYYEILDVFMNAIDRIILRCMLTTVLIINLIKSSFSSIILAHETIKIHVFIMSKHILSVGNPSIEHSSL